MNPRFFVTLRRFVAPIAAVVSASAAVIVGAVAIYTNIQSIAIIEKQRQQFEDGQYERQQSSIALAWRTIGGANGQAFELGQSASVIHLAQIGELRGNITLNGSYLDFSAPQASSLLRKIARSEAIWVNLDKSAFCKTTIEKFGPQNDLVFLNSKYSLLRQSTLVGYFVSDDFLAADLRSATLRNLIATNARFAGADLRRVTFQGGQFSKADFQGADLREVVSRRGSIGFGLGSSGLWSFESYTPDSFMRGAREWPVLFENNVGLSEMLAAVDRSPATSRDNYLVDFSNANFADADLRGAKLKQSNITQAQLNVACADATTELPEAVRVIKTCERSSIVEEKVLVLRQLRGDNQLLEKSCAEVTEPASDK
jgi:uncharacterized protein YjbI with pentapeptide repeats